MEFDSRQFPRTADYVKRLPNGLSSFPECRVKSDVHEGLRNAFPDLGSRGEMPEIVHAYLTDRYRDKWLPEAVGNSLVLMARDCCFSSDEEYLDWCRENMRNLFDKPLYRVMMNVFSTSLIVMGASKRWTAFHEGSQLGAKPIKKTAGRFQTIGVLTYPSHLFGGLITSQLAATYMAALDINRAAEPEVISKDVSDTESHFFVSWQS